jgi:hypothetical protein
VNKNNYPYKRDFVTYTPYKQSHQSLGSGVKPVTMCWVCTSNASRILDRKPLVMRPHWRPKRRRLEDNIKMDLGKAKVEINVTHSGFCTLSGSGFTGVRPLGSIAIQLSQLL